MIIHMSLSEGCCCRFCTLHTALSEVRRKNWQFSFLGRGKEELNNARKYLSLLKCHWFFYLNNLEKMSASLFRITYMWIFDKGNFWHDRHPLLVCCIITWPHICVCGVSTIFPVQPTLTIMLPYLSMKLIVHLLGFYVLSVMILLLITILVSIKWVTGTLYHPPTPLCSLPMMRLRMPCMMGTLASVIWTWSFIRLPLVVVASFRPLIVSLL